MNSKIVKHNITITIVRSNQNKNITKQQIYIKKCMSSHVKHKQIKSQILNINQSKETKQSRKEANQSKKEEKIC
jgi:hypothetical protein